MSNFEIIDDVKDAIPKLSDFKNMKKMKPFLIVGAGLGAIYLFTRKPAGTISPNNQMSYDDSGVMSGDDIGGLMTDYANQNNEQVSASNDTIMNALFDKITAQNDKISAVQDEFNSKYDGLVSGQAGMVEQEMPVENVINYGIVNYGNNGEGYTPEASTKNLATLFSSPTAMVTELKRVEEVIANRTKAGMDISRQLTYKNTITKEAGVDFGNNGAGYTAESGKALTTKLNTDSTFKASEITRTNEVIANRTKAGLDTSLQLKYLATLK